MFSDGCTCTNNFNICFISIVCNLLPLISFLSIRITDISFETHITSLISICCRFSADQLAAPQTFGVSFIDLFFTHVGLAYLRISSFCVSVFIHELLLSMGCFFIMEDNLKQSQQPLKPKQVDDSFHVSY